MVALKSDPGKMKKSMSNNEDMKCENFERKECEKIARKQVGRCEARKKELKNESCKCRKKYRRLKFV